MLLGCRYNKASLSNNSFYWMRNLVMHAHLVLLLIGWSIIYMLLCLRESELTACQSSLQIWVFFALLILCCKIYPVILLHLIRFLRCAVFILNCFRFVPMKACKQVSTG